MYLSFINTLKIILTKRFVLIKQNRNFKPRYDDKQFKCKKNFQFGLLIFVSKYCVFFYSVIVRMICLFDNFEKLSIFTWILKRCIGRVPKGLMRTCISSTDIYFVKV